MISYLPADDIYFKHHLQSLVEALVTTNSNLAFSGIQHNSNSVFDGNYGIKSFGQMEGFPLQLVQTLHVKTKDKWIEREELVTDDLHRMFWHNFYQQKNKIVGSLEVTCEWIDHLHQRNKMINDRRGGGIYMYKKYYHVTHPIGFQSSLGNLIDEIGYYKPFKSNRFIMKTVLKFSWLEN